jgi:hypothetical protein
VGSEITRSNQSGLTRSTRPQVGVGADPESAEYKRQALRYELDVPSEFRVGAAAEARPALPWSGSAEEQSSRSSELVLRGRTIAPRPTEPVYDENELIASCLEELHKPRRNRGRVVQRRVGWLAYPDRVVVTTVERELRQTQERRYAPAGPWLIEQRLTYRHAGGRGSRRRGQVRADSEQQSGPQGPAGAAGGEHVGGDPEKKLEAVFPTGTYVFRFLPRPVRESMVARVPQPTFYLGYIIQRQDEHGDPSRYAVDLLRMSAERAVVVHAELPVGAPEWQVTQVDYNLTEPEIEQA